jgi:hypothetical protein
MHASEPEGASMCAVELPACVQSVKMCVACECGNTCAVSMCDVLGNAFCMHIYACFHRYSCVQSKVVRATCLRRFVQSSYATVVVVVLHILPLQKGLDVVLFCMHV